MAVISAVCGCGRGAPSAGTPIVLITVDTLRADHVGVYGRERVATPHIDRLAHEGAVAEMAVAPIARTTQSVATIVTGLHPFRHGADGLGTALPERVTTIAERLRAHGYRTAAFVSNVNLAPDRHFDQGFDVYRDPPSRWKGDSAMALSREVEAWLAAEHPGRGLFLWVHYLDPHWPYEPDPEYLRLTDPDASAAGAVAGKSFTKGELLFAADRLLDSVAIDRLRRRYAAEVAQTDAAVGILLEALRREHLLDDAIVVFTSDHGEAMGDHAYWFGHGEMLYDGTLHVPLLFRAPGRIPPGTRLSGVVPLEDVVPTVLGLAGLPVDAGEFDGADLSGLLVQGGELRAPSAVLLHANDYVHLHPGNPRRRVPGPAGRWLGVRTDGWKLIRIPTGGGRFEQELFHVADDAEETDDLAARYPERVAALSALLDETLGRFDETVWNRPRERDEREPGDGKVEDALRNLGYLAD